MDEQCFYCHAPLEETNFYGAFIYQNEHLEKPLCQECYKDWLEGIKE
ncbi:hypothetical protein [Neobacillus sp. D3-1R]